MSVETSPAGEAVSGSDPDDKTFVCPSCERSFDSLNGRNVHHYQAHGESIAKTTIECAWCGGKFESYKHNTERKYCSDSCRAESVSKQVSGENSVRWVERIEIACDECDDLFEVKQSEVDSRRFCSRDCRYSNMETAYVGEGHPRWVENTLTFECEYCGEEYENHESLEGDTRFCSKRCHNEAQSIEFAGSNNPSWKGGYSNYYGANWSEQRKKALKRDENTCQACGDTAKENGRELSVHHITPLRVFKEDYDDPEWWEKGNELDNLMTFCMDCHREWEGIPLAPQ